MQLHIYKDANEVIVELANWITAYITQTLQNQERFTIALSGGETPKALYKLLATDAYLNKIDWSKIHIFWGDERVVPFTDDSNNAKMTFDNLLYKVNAKPENIHTIKTDIEPDVAAIQYEEILHEYFNNTANSFDLVLLGMGKDGHTLSLFPSSYILHEPQHWVNAVYLEDQKMHRITLMPSLVNKAASVVFLVTGSEKSMTINAVLHGPPKKYPAQLIQPGNGNLHWFLDEDAAREFK
jgi:6-phosphogluconolactonase